MNGPPSEAKLPIAVEAVQLCYRAAGGTAIYESSPFERALRDVNAAATHITTRRVMMEEAAELRSVCRPRLHSSNSSVAVSGA